MKSLLFKVRILVALLFLAVVFSVYAGRSEATHAQPITPQSGGRIVFTHIATTSNSAGDYTDIDNPATNNNPNAILEVTSNWAPHNVYDDSTIGVWYHASVGKWSIFNQNLKVVPDQAAFNVQVLPSISSVFIHVATTSNSAGDYTDIDNPATNNNPNAILEITSNWNPGGVGGVYNNHHIGVWYHASVGKWSVFNQDFVAIPNQAAFNVQVLSASSSTFVHMATSSNSTDDYTDIDNPTTNVYPAALVFVTPNWNPGGSGGTYNDHAIGVWYHSGKWSIFNQDLRAFPNQATFNVYVLPSISADLVPSKSGNPPSYCNVTTINGRQILIARVQNLGYASSGLFNTRLEFSTFSGPVILTQRTSVGALSFVDLNFDITGGFYTDLSYKLTVDANNEVLEANENNNVISVTCVG